MADAPRAADRDALHGPWPTEAEALQAKYPDWEISRELRADGTHGDWYARRDGTSLQAETPAALRDLLEKQSV
ncbi:hypothetical protein ACFPZ0_05740 [Streptomonospora nanhaiensis]|uniref:hypothetical protein n=1 Tax=Streptomonospora nanhaiensis TaxID=1323731 RepID=UPI001C99D3FD|nr:hypothetical protein [Streptomonospora nanhaiensis]MBX9391585.1 hypothetical protein [Streptomonospora nanhaiensis]